MRITDSWGGTPVLQPASTPACSCPDTADLPRASGGPAWTKIHFSVETKAGRPERPPQAESLPHQWVFIPIGGRQAQTGRAGSLASEDLVVKQTLKADS